MVGLVGPDGLPVSSKKLAEEVATPTVMGVRATHMDGVASGLKPERLAHILKQASLGNARDYLTLAEEMEERYLHYASQVQTRRLAIEGVTPAVESPKGYPKAIVDAVHELVDDPNLLDAIGTLTDGIAKGYAVVEPMWEYERKRLRPVAFKWRDPRYFQFDRIGLTELRLAVDGNLDGVPIDKPTFIVHMPRSKTGIPLRRGFARAATWAFLLQSFGLKDWAAFAEIYGIPMRVGKYHAGASDADKKALLRAVASIANDAAAIIPQGMELEFIEAQGAKGEAVFGGLLDYLDKQVSKLVVGQTMTADDGSSQAQAKIHDNVRLDITQADCRQLGNTLNRDLIPWYVSLNFGPQDVYPKVTLPVAEPEDIKELTEAVARLVPFGLKVGQKQMRAKIGLSEPDDDDEMLTPASPPTPTSDPDADAEADEAPPAPAPRARKAALSAHHSGCRCASCQPVLPAFLAADPGKLDSEDELDDFVAEALADWQEDADPLLAPLREVLEKATSFAELEAMLPGIAGRIDGAKLAMKLAIAMAKARGLGDARD